MSSETDNSAPIDRISNLPDELICHILSFLPTRQAFATKRLSKRWALLCYSLSVLSFLFDDGTVQDDDDGTILDDDDETVLDDDYSIAIYWFCHFVDTLVLSPSAINKSINTFSLTFISRSYDVDNQRFHAWVEAAKQRHVKEFHLFMNNVTLNPTIFTSQTLVVLKLERLKVEAETLIVDFPSLKTLHLRFVRFQNKNDFMKLLNACPILEDLHTSHPRYVENNEVEEFKTLFLSKLVRADIGPIDVPFNAISKVEFLRIDYEQKATLTSIPVFRNLIHIELLFYHFFLGWDSVIELLQLCPKLQILYLKKWSTRLSKNWKSPIPSIECISSHLRSCTLLNFDGSGNDLRFATYILQNAMLLEVMKINFTASFSNGVRENQIKDKLSTCPRMSMGCNLLFESI